MSDDSFLSSLPDAPLKRSALEAIDRADGVKRAISVTWKRPTSRSDDAETEHTDDVIVITDGRVRYLSRVPGEGWSIAREETYADDQEFEEVMDEVHDYAVEHSREKMK